MNDCEQFYHLSLADFVDEKYIKTNGIYVHPKIKDLTRPIYRYIQIEHLLSMLDREELYIPNRKRFKDKAEHGHKFNPKNTFPLTIVSKNYSKNGRKLDNTYEKWVSAYNLCISCWTYDVQQTDNSDYIAENYLMWKSYGENSVCCRIETTISELIQSIEDINIDILISDVSYVKEHLSDNIAQHYIFEKSIYYRDEKEIRLCVLKTADAVCLKIDPFRMIKHIILSPFIGNNLSDLIIGHLKTAYPNWNIPIEKSHIMENINL